MNHLNWSMSADDTPLTEGDADVAVLEKTEYAEPPLYQVILHNDDYTPMDFVVGVLQDIFSLPIEKATYVMLDVHKKGRGVCGQFAYDIAETKVMQVTELAASHEHPLLCTMEALI